MNLPQANLSYPFEPQPPRLRWQLMDQWLSARGIELRIVDPDGRELDRSSGLQDLVHRWFEAGELSVDGLPRRMRAWHVELSQQPANDPPVLLHYRVQTQVGCYLVVAGQVVNAAETGPHYVVSFAHRTRRHTSLPDELAQRLTPRQREVATGILHGWSNQLISDTLGCTVGTVKKHTAAILKCFDLDSRLDLLLLALSSREKENA